MVTFGGDCLVARRGFGCGALGLINYCIDSNKLARLNKDIYNFLNLHCWKVSAIFVVLLRLLQCGIILYKSYDALS